MDANLILFLLIALFTLISAALVAFSNKIIYSAFALLATLLGFAAFYVFLNADFLAVAQIMIYVGGILILILFGVMLTQKIYDTSRKDAHNPLLPALSGGIILGGIIIMVILRSPWSKSVDKVFQPTTRIIGRAILTDYLLPFEIISILLLGALIGAVYLARSEDHK